MKSVLIIFVSLFIAVNSNATSPIPVGDGEPTYINSIEDSSFVASDLYLSFSAIGKCRVSQCFYVSRTFNLLRGNSSEEALKEVKKVFLLAYSLKRAVQFSVIHGTDNVDISKPISLLD